MCSLWAGTNCLNSEETTQLRRMATWEKGLTLAHKGRCGTKERDRLRGSRGWNSALGRRSRVRGSVVGPLSHVALLLSCVVSSEFKHHLQYVYIIVPCMQFILSRIHKRYCVCNHIYLPLTTFCRNDAYSKTPCVGMVTILLFLHNTWINLLALAPTAVW